MQAPGNHPARMRGLTAIFAIAHDRMADMRHMHAQLVRAPGQRPQRHKGIAPCRMVNPPQFADGMLAGIIHLHQLMAGRPALG